MAAPKAKPKKTRPSLEKLFLKLATKIQKEAQSSYSECQSLLIRSEGSLRRMDERLAEYKQDLEGILRTTATAEETLCNVLLAIRQNEYLQAYYPAQHGFPDLRVVGTHPANHLPKEAI